MTEHQHALAQALARCTFSPGTTAKRFVRWASSQPIERELSDKAAAFLERLGHSYRRQLGRCMAERCDICTRPNATARRCPTCGAAPGKPCRAKGKATKRLMARDARLVHAARLDPGRAA